MDLQTFRLVALDWRALGRTIREHVVPSTVRRAPERNAVTSVARRGASALIVLAVSAIGSGCSDAAMIAGQRSRMLADLHRRAEFDMDCRSLAMVDLSQATWPYAATVGVRGCGRRATYVYEWRESHWSLERGFGVVDPPLAGGSPSDASAPP
jgi:hypothetical protein